MSVPVRKVEIYDGANLRYDITTKVNSIDFELPITDAIGKFQLQTSVEYNDIALGDIVKIYLGYDTVPENPVFAGILKGDYPSLTVGAGSVRVLEGLDFGEIAQRKHKTKRWESVGASTIVTELANDLGFGTSHIESDATSLTYTASDMLYFDILKDISYIRDKDFYVAPNKDLYWFTRQTIGTNTTTLTEGSNILVYNLKQDNYKKANKVTVYGEENSMYPTVEDQYTEQTGSETPADDGWTSNGTLSWDNTDGNKKVGNESLKATITGNEPFLDITNTFPNVTYLDCRRWPKNSYKNLFFYLKMKTDIEEENWVTISLKNSANVYYYKIYDYKESDVFHTISEELGPDKGWSVVGSPSWDLIAYFEVRIGFYRLGNYTIDAWIDGWNFKNKPFVGTASYGSADHEVVILNNDLHSDAECTNYANAVLSYRKTPINHLDISLIGDTTIERGKLINVVIPSRSINTTYDVINVRHHLGLDGGLVTNVVTSKEKGIRTPADTMDLSMFLSGINQKAILSLRGIEQK